MHWFAFDKAALPAFGALFLLSCSVLPSMKLYRRTGRWPVARTRQAGERGVLLAMAGLTLFWVAWGALFPALGPRRLDVWRAGGLLEATGWALALAGLVLATAGQRQMGAAWRVGIEPETPRIVRHGLFRHVRNPIYAGVATMALGIALVTPSPWTLSGWLAVVAVVSLEARREERHLLALHGADYEAYAASTGRFLPRLGRSRN